MTRFVSVTVLVVMLAATRVASAQGATTLPDGSTISFDKLYIHEDGGDLVEPKKPPDSLWNYFNLAHCQCSKDAPDSIESTFAYLMTLQNVTTPNTQTLEIWVGSACDNETNRLMTCRELSDQNVTPISSIQQTNGTTRVISLFDAMTPESMATACVERTQTATVWAIADGNGDGTRDFFVSKPVNTDSQPPPLPTGFRAAGGDEAIEISWTPPIDTNDTYAYQALCARADDDSPGKTSGRPTRRYATAHTLCGLKSIDLPGTEIPTPDGAPDPMPVPTLPDGLQNLDAEFLCGENFSSTATSLRIGGLENGVAYKVVLLAVDKFQNAKGTFFTSTLTPVPSTDFWEDIHERGGKADGGLCLLAEAYGNDSSLTGALRSFRDDTLGGSRLGRWLTTAYYASLGKLGAYVHGSAWLRVTAAIVLAPVVAVALAWHWLTLPGVLGVIAAAWLWRHRRRVVVRWARRIGRTRALRTGTAIAVLALGASRAHAGGGFQPYWENTDPIDENQSAADDQSLIKWHAGIRVGPYTPEIDKQVGGTGPGPYEQMFGGARVLPMLDVDRILWTGFGQVGVGLSVGYMQKSAHTFTIGSMASDNPRARSGADSNKFRLIPLELSATYRFTWFDDQYGVPIVPYARGGLAYYPWWVSLSSGSLAKVCSDGSMTPDGSATPGCSASKAFGASLGVQASIGLAIRAERIDSSTATSMRQSGIEHAGIYAELSLAKVDGFGSDSKLSVGDRTWFAGVDFEF